MKHSISNVNESTKYGDCKVCGVGSRVIQSFSKRASDPKWVCAVVKERNDKYNSAYEHPLNRVREQMREEHGSLCDICEMEATGSGHENRLHYDHEKSSKLHRGWLCGPCNRGLGNFKDNPQILLAAAQYLVNFSNRSKM